MSKRDTSHIVKGARLIGGVYPGMRIVKSADPPRYGEPEPSRPTAPSFAQISEQLDAARKRLEEIAKAVRAAKARR